MQASTAPAKFREDATFIHSDCMHTVLKWVLEKSLNKHDVFEFKFSVWTQETCFRTLKKML